MYLNCFFYIYIIKSKWKEMLKDMFMMKFKLNFNIVRLFIIIVVLVIIYFIYMVVGYGYL